MKTTETNTVQHTVRLRFDSLYPYEIYNGEKVVAYIPNTILEEDVERIKNHLNAYDKLKADNTALLEALKNAQYYLETAINATPTGAIRNILTDANIATLTAIKATEQ